MSDNYLNAQQMTQVKLRVGEMVSRHVNDMQYRKWAIEQALAHIAPGENLIDVARSIYHFVVPDLDALNVTQTNRSETL